MWSVRKDMEPPRPTGIPSKLMYREGGSTARLQMLSSRDRRFSSESMTVVLLLGDLLDMIGVGLL